MGPSPYDSKAKKRDGYYVGFGRLEDISKAFSHGFVYEGQYSAFRGRPHGTSARHLPGDRFVVFAQNHDQVGNRAMGERLVALTSFEALKLAAALVLWSPYVPLLFMGEEYGEPAPFHYFTSFSDGALAEAVRKGRREEFTKFAWKAEVPDPQDPRAFQASTLHLWLRSEPGHRELLAFYKALIHLRKIHASLGFVGWTHQIVHTLSGDEVLAIYRWIPQGEESVVVFHLGGAPKKVAVPIPRGRWMILLDSEAKAWGGQGGFMAPGDATQPDGTLEVGIGPYQVIGLLRAPAPRGNQSDKGTERKV